VPSRTHEPKHLGAGTHEPDNIVTNSRTPRFKMPRGTASGLSSLSPVLVSRSPALSSGFVPACKSRGPSVTLPPAHAKCVLGTASPSRPTFVHPAGTPRVSSPDQASASKTLSCMLRAGRGSACCRSGHSCSARRSIARCVLRLGTRSIDQHVWFHRSCGPEQQCVSQDLMRHLSAEKRCYDLMRLHRASRP
jgi:hypothetical protein